MREKLIEMIRKADKEDHESLTQDVHYAFMADHLIANGVVPVVRCKDCKFYMTIHCICDGCCISDDWYCAGGERRVNAEN